MKIKLYIDFDGVILDSIDVSYRLIEENGIELKDENYDKIQKFFIEIDWKEIIKQSKPINNSIENIKEILKSNLYDTTILTHVNSKNEIKIKQEYLEQVLPGIDVIYVEKKHNKCDVVECKNTILVDDFMGNLELWEKKGGIPIKFSTTGKQYSCISIDNLKFLLDNYNEIKGLIETNSNKILKKDVV